MVHTVRMYIFPQYCHPLWNNTILTVSYSCFIIMNCCYVASQLPYIATHIVKYSPQPYTYLWSCKNCRFSIWPIIVCSHWIVLCSIDIYKPANITSQQQVTNQQNLEDFCTYVLVKQFIRESQCMDNFMHEQSVKAIMFSTIAIKSLNGQNKIDHFMSHAALYMGPVYLTVKITFKLCVVFMIL